MSASEASRARIVKALLANERRRNRGRPRKGQLQDDDTLRAAMVVLLLFAHPGKFKTRREAIRYLQSLCRVAGALSRVLHNQGSDPDSRVRLAELSRRFPLGDLEVSVSRGMHKHGRLLLRAEKLAKNSV
jgi:hypothetical protein